jgi:hypothetical protein
MKLAFAIIAVVTVLAANVSAIVPSRAAELAVGGGEVPAVHHYRFWRVRPQSCFLMPDVIVALNALGPYCSSPRRYSYHYY